jgi:hypothetical protein
MAWLSLRAAPPDDPVLRRSKLAAAIGLGVCGVALVAIMVAFVVQERQRQASVQQLERDRVEVERQEREATARREREAWSALPLARCKAPEAAADCDDVAAYLKHYPDGAHADEARAALGSSRAQRDALADDAAWASAAPERCRRAAVLDACKGIGGYLSDHPGGRHADEAGAVLSAASPALQRISADIRKKRAAFLDAYKKTNHCKEVSGVEPGTTTLTLTGCDGSLAISGGDDARRASSLGWQQLRQKIGLGYCIMDLGSFKSNCSRRGWPDEQPASP